MIPLDLSSFLDAGQLIGTWHSGGLFEALYFFPLL